MGFVTSAREKKESTSLLIILAYYIAHGFIKIKGQNFQLHRNKTTNDIKLFLDYNKKL